MKEELRNLILGVLKRLAIEAGEFVVEHPADLSHGDYSTNVAMAVAKAQKSNPRLLAEKIVAELQKEFPRNIEKIEIAGPGFINFHLSKDFFASAISEILKEGEVFGKNKIFAGRKVMCEYTQPNPFKILHIGHMMNNMVGEAISRIIQASGAEVKRATYHGDVGLHVAKTIWGFQKMGGEMSVETLGKAYAFGTNAYEDDETAKKEITDLNKIIYEKSDEKISELYEKGKKISLEHFAEIYKKLGSAFDFHFFESESGPLGKEIVLANVGKVFEKSDGAIIFHGEKYDPSLHTRVFINKEGLPTYEAKDLGLVEVKLKKYHFDLSLTLTAMEQTEYFRVVKKAMELVFPEYAGKIRHVPHGHLKLPTGKMSSRTGDVIGAEILLRDVEKLVLEKIADRSMTEAEKEKVAEQVAIGAIKYSILRQSPGKDVIFDFDKSLSFEGDSGPYLQYSAVRAHSVLLKAELAGVTPSSVNTSQAVSDVEKMLYRFPEIVELALKEYSPQYISTYLMELAGAFNSYYGNTKIIDIDAGASYRVALTSAFRIVLTNGLTLLGISVPQKM